MATGSGKQWDLLIVHADIATMAHEQGIGPYGAIADGAVATRGDTIAWVGPCSELPAAPETLAREVIDAKGQWLLPGLIDCHTHLVYGGSRAGEFEQRLEGATYEDIARAGGGIRATVRATRAASEDALFDSAAARAGSLLAEGVTTIEIKSGYGLNLEDEFKQLRVARRLGRELPFTCRTTYLGAHSIPPEYSDRPDDYVDLVCNEGIPAVREQKLADAVDVYCERIAFDATQTERIFRSAREHGLAVKIHSEQLSDMGGASVAARYGALSCDHVEHLSRAGMEAMAESGTVATLLPGAFYFLRDTQVPPVQGLREHGIPMSIATDCNPGTSPVTSLLLMLNMGCVLFRMTPYEALAGVTRHAARALGMLETHGTVEVGKQADLALYGISEPAELCYRFGFNPCRAVVQQGVYRSGH